MSRVMSFLFSRIVFIYKRSGIVTLGFRIWRKEWLGLKVVEFLLIVDISYDEEGAYSLRLTSVMGLSKRRGKGVNKRRKEVVNDLFVKEESMVFA